MRRHILRPRVAVITPAESNDAGVRPGRVARNAKFLLRTRHNVQSQAALEPVADSKHIVTRIILPILLVVLALLSAAAVAWGTHPDWARYERGLDWIMTARRLQWPLATLCMLCCVILIALAISGKRRAWWLLALGPVVFLFHERFSGEAYRTMTVLDQPHFVAPDEATFLKDDSEIVGLVFEGVPYAYAQAALNRSPVVVHADADKRLMLMWNPYASRAVAYLVEHTIKPREIDIVSMPANAMLLYNGRIGQFINAFTGLTPEGERPSGFVAPVDAYKTSWRGWRKAYPQTRVLAAPLWNGEEPQQRFAHRPVKMEAPPRSRVALLATTKPVAFAAEQVGPDPINLSAGKTNLLLLRDKAGRLRAFDRSVKGDLFPTFQKRTIPRKPDVALVDSDTQSLWSLDGRCLDGFAKGETLRPVNIEQDLPLGVLASYYPDLEVVDIPAAGPKAAKPR